MKRFGRWCWECWLRVIPKWIAPRIALALLLTILIVLGIWLIPTIFLRPNLDGEDPKIYPVSPAPAAGCPTRGRPAYRCEINSIRRANGLVPLRPNLRLVRAARRHAADMVRRHYFSHDTPEGTPPQNRIRAAGYLKGAHHWNIGETIGYGSGPAGSPSSIVTAWMNSPPHRAIILDPDFRDGGAGIVNGTPTGAAGVTVVLNVGRRSG